MLYDRTISDASGLQSDPQVLRLCASDQSHPRRRVPPLSRCTLSLRYRSYQAVTLRGSQKLQLVIPGSEAHCTLLASSNMCYQAPRALTPREYARNTRTGSVCILAKRYSVLCPSSETTRSTATVQTGLGNKYLTLHHLVGHTVKPMLL